MAEQKHAKDRNKRCSRKYKGSGHSNLTAKPGEKTVSAICLLSFVSQAQTVPESLELDCLISLRKINQDKSILDLLEQIFRLGCGHLFSEGSLTCFFWPPHLWQTSDLTFLFLQFLLSVFAGSRCSIGCYGR